MTNALEVPHAATAQSHEESSLQKTRDSTLAPLTLAALGVVYGDIGTSPLYALRECFHGDYGIAVTNQNLGDGIFRIIAHYDFMEEPNFTLSRDKGIELEMKDASFFLGRENLGIHEESKMSRWRSNLFLFLSKNSMDVSSYFGIPLNQVIEGGIQLDV